jgi:hypothetical protein
VSFPSITLTLSLTYSDSFSTSYLVNMYMAYMKHEAFQHSFHASSPLPSFSLQVHIRYILAIRSKEGKKEERRRPKRVQGRFRTNTSCAQGHGRSRRKFARPSLSPVHPEHLANSLRPDPPPPISSKRPGCHHVPYTYMYTLQAD